MEIFVLGVCIHEHTGSYREPRAVIAISCQSYVGFMSLLTLPLPPNDCYLSNCQVAYTLLLQEAELNKVKYQCVRSHQEHSIYCEAFKSYRYLPTEMVHSFISRLSFKTGNKKN